MKVSVHIFTAVQDLNYNQEGWDIMIDHNEILCGDFRDFKCPENARLVIADPPLNIGKIYLNGLEKTPYEIWVKELIGWSCAPRTIIFGHHMNIYDWLPKIQKPSWILYWHKTFALSRRNSYGWFPSLVPILVYEKKNAPWYGIPQKGVKVPRDCILATSVMGDSARHRKVFPQRGPKHPAVTGTAVMNQLITVTTQVGDLVVDPMCGIGSSLVACLRNHRNFWGIDIVPEYVEAAKIWIKYEKQLLGGVAE